MSSLCPEVVTASIQVNLAKDGLIAFVTPATVNPSHIRDIMAGTLPKYMVPTAIVPLTTLPLSPSGKVDHNMVKQRQAELEAGVYSSKAMATKSETEIPPNIATQPASFTQPIAEISLPVSTSELASDDLIGNVSKIWRDVLGLESIPKFDVNFFDLGGHRLVGGRLSPNFLPSCDSTKRLTYFLLFFFAIPSAACRWLAFTVN